MTERELREKLQSAYGTMPDATRAAFEHSLTHHRVETRNPVRILRLIRTGLRVSTRWCVSECSKAARVASGMVP